MWLNITQLILALLLIVIILLQNKGSGLSGIFGGGSSNVYRTKRGAEKFLHTATIIISFCFLVLSFINVLF